MYKDGHLEVVQNEHVCFPCTCPMQRRLSKSQDDKLTHSGISGIPVLNEFMFRVVTAIGIEATHRLNVMDFLPPRLIWLLPPLRA